MHLYVKDAIKFASYASLLNVISENKLKSGSDRVTCLFYLTRHNSEPDQN